MKRLLWLIAAVIALAFVGAFTWSFATKGGVLVSTGDYFDYDALGVEPDLTVTYEPIGRTCKYLMYDGVHTAVLIETDALESARQPGGAIDPRLESAIPVETWYDASCPFTHRIGS